MSLSKKKPERRQNKIDKTWYQKELLGLCFSNWLLIISFLITLVCNLDKIGENLKMILSYLR